MSNQCDLEKRKSDLEEFLKSLIIRKDVFSTEEFRHFLKLDIHAVDTDINHPERLGDFEGLTLCIRDMKYIIEAEVLLCCSYDHKIASRIDSYLTNVKLPWEKEVKASIVGALECWRLSPEPENDKIYKCNRLW